MLPSRGKRTNGVLFLLRFNSRLRWGTVQYSANPVLDRRGQCAFLLLELEEDRPDCPAREWPVSVLERRGHGEQHIYQTRIGRPRSRIQCFWPSVSPERRGEIEQHIYETREGDLVPECNGPCFPEFLSGGEI